MNRADHFIGLAVLLLVAAGCDDQAARPAAPAPAASSAARQAQISPAQKQFIAIEAVAISRGADSLPIPGRVA